MDSFHLSLSEADKTSLKDLALLSITSRLTGHGPGTPPEPDSELTRRELGAFVTLKREGRLRGCIGNIIGQGPLYETVWNMARAAAFDDPRFPPLTRPELDGLELEISILGPHRALPGPGACGGGPPRAHHAPGRAAGAAAAAGAAGMGWTAGSFGANLPQGRPARQRLARPGYADILV